MYLSFWGRKAQRLFNVYYCCGSFERTQTDYDVELDVEKSLRNISFNDKFVFVFDKLAKNDCSSSFEIIKDTFGYVPVVKNSNAVNGGLGVFVEGVVSAGEVVGIYPGLIYEPEDPALWCSWRNDYFLRRGDGSSVDGKFYGLSGWMYKSTAAKNAMHSSEGITEICDKNWIDYSRQMRQNYLKRTKHVTPISNPLNIGHFINCASNGKRANVMYYEYDFGLDFPIELRKYIPNVSYNSNQYAGDLLVKSILMISLLPLQNEELFADYSFIGTS